MCIIERKKNRQISWEKKEEKIGLKKPNLSRPNPDQRQWFCISPAQQYPGSLNNNSAGTPASSQTYSERHLAWEGEAGRGRQKQRR